MGTDPNGTTEWWEWLLLGLAVVVAVGVVVLGTALTGGAATIGFAGLIGSTLSGAGIGFLGGASASILMQGAANNWDFSKIDPMNALISGAIGGAIGAVGGAFSYCVGAVGEVIGSTIGEALSSMSFYGHNVAKVFEYIGGANMIVSLTSTIGRFTGAIFGSIIANEGMNRLFGREITFEDNFKDSLMGELQGTILGAMYKFFKWLR